MELDMDVPKGLTNLTSLPRTWFCVLCDLPCQPRPFSVSDRTSALNAIVTSSAHGNQCSFGAVSEDPPVPPPTCPQSL